MNRGRAFLGVVAFAIPAALASAPAAAGGFHEDFIPIISAAEPGEHISGIVVLQDRLDVTRAEAEIESRGYTSRWRRHQFVVTEARQLARRTQGEILSWLDEQRAQGLVRDYQAFWIVNAVAVEAVPGVFDRLVLRPDVELIYENAVVDLRLGWEDDSAPPPVAGGLYPGQICINVADAWSQGYTGSGRLVCDFDTGADGNHEALADKWRGLEAGVDWSEAWHDPYTNTQFPYDSGSHGSHTLGIMIGTPPGDDPIGIAYEAKWIAAGILIGYNVQKIIASYQWAADPDGNPGTIDDVPDVINNSWGTSDNCSNTYWNAIDVVEAAGIVNTIAVDNTGPGNASVNSPESRADSPYQNFGVGNVNPHQQGCPINSSSGRGPSPCDNVSIKPEVTAPGTSIYSSVPGGYANFSGTSMACPHVSGAVAILRQADPDLEVDEVKQYLMESARDQGNGGEDNTYGWGVIDVSAALEAVLDDASSLPGPMQLAFEILPPNDVRLTWRPPHIGGPGNPIQGYNIYRAPSDENFPEDPIGSVPVGVLTYTDEGLAEGVYNYVVTVAYSAGESGPSNVVEVEIEAPSSVGSPFDGAQGLALAGSPNPFSPGGVLRYRLATTEPARLVIYDARGRTIRSQEIDAGAATGDVIWEGRDASGRRVPSGIYFAQLEQGTRRVQSRLVVLR
jgi:subtilisin family serine protease